MTPKDPTGWYFAAQDPEDFVRTAGNDQYVLIVRDDIEPSDPDADETSPDENKPKTRKRLLPVAIALVSLLALLGLLAVLNNNEEQAAAPEVAPADGRPQGAIPVDSGSSYGLAWSVGGPMGSVRGVMTSVAVVGSSAVVGGYADGVTLSSDGTRGPTLATLWLLSPSGWEHIDRDTLLEEDDMESASLVADVAVGPGGLVGVGSIGDRAAIWHSDDGRAWQKAATGPQTPSSDTDTTEVAALVAATDSSWLTIGFGATPIAWVSTDGTRWTRVQNPFGAVGDAADLEITSIAASKTRFVAGGSVTTQGSSGEKRRQAVTWTSNDGREWTQTTASAHVGAESIAGLIANADGEILAFGYPAGMWKLDENGGWIETEGGMPPGFERPSVRGAWIEDRIFLLHDATPRGVSYSTDMGIGWTDLDGTNSPMDDSAIPHDVALHGANVVLVGESRGATPNDNTAAVWIAEWVELD